MSLERLVSWPVGIYVQVDHVRGVSAALDVTVGDQAWLGAATRAFFGVRAATWVDRFPDDGPAFAAAIQALAPPAGGTALDLGCGTGRALPDLRTAVGPGGTVIGFTPEMLVEAHRRGRTSEASLVLGDASHLPLPDCSSDVVLAAGLLTHLPDSNGGAEFARVTRLGGRLAIFHPIGRAALAARHGHELRPNDIRAEPAIRTHLSGAGWRVDMVDDGPDRTSSWPRACRTAPRCSRSGARVPAPG